MNPVTRYNWRRLPVRMNHMTLAAGIACCIVTTSCQKSPAVTTPTKPGISSTAAQPSSASHSPAIGLPDTTLELSAQDVTIARGGHINQIIHANGTLHAIQHSIVRAKVSGEIIATERREGERVNAGQILARIDDSEYVARVKDRRAALEAGRAQAALAESTRSRNQELLQKKFISGLAYDNSQSAATIAASQVQSLEAQLNLAEKALADTVVRAPITGWVAERTVQRGDKTSPDGKLFTLVDLSHLELEALVPANEISRVTIGQSFTANIEGFSNKSFTGQVSRIGAQANSGSRSITIYIDIANPDATLKAGLFAKGSLRVGHHPTRVQIPDTALHNEAGIAYVYVIDNEHIRRIPVELGIHNESDGIVEILKGIEPETRVVTANLGPIKEGAHAIIATLNATAASTSPNR